MSKKTAVEEPVQEAPVEEVREKSLGQMMKERPQDFDFSHIPVGAEALGRSPISLKVMVGGFEYAGKDEISLLEFFGRKPKLLQIDQIIDLLNEPLEQEGAGGTKAVMRRTADIVANLLYVQTDDAWRPATPDELYAAFDLDELLKFRDRWFPTQPESAEGEAPVQPITA